MSVIVLPPIAPDRTWVTEGNCHKEQPMSLDDRTERLGIFFMVNRNSRKAIAICNGTSDDRAYPRIQCPVAAECYSYAKEAKIQYGVWGGEALNRDAEGNNNVEEVA